MENKRSLSTILFGVALLIFVVATFAMFGAVVVRNGSGPYPSMFDAAFGTSASDSIRVKGLTTLFVFQMIAVAGVIAVIVGTVTNKFHYILTIVLYVLVCLCALIALIISFNSVDLYCSSRGSSPIRAEYSLGPGPIAFSVLHIIGLLMSAAGLVLSRKGK